MSFQKYATYKDSGTAWLGKIPAHWEVKPLKYLSHINSRVLSESTDPDYEFDYVDIGSVSPAVGIAKTERIKFASAPSRARRLVQEGDVIVSTVRTYLRAIAPIKRSAENLVVSTGFCVVSPRDELKSAYCSYLLQSTFFVETVVAQSVGVSYPATNASDIANIKIPLPNAKEQRKIAAFLDRETAQIAALIDEQTRLISLLGEKRQAVISNAITKGLNPNFLENKMDRIFDNGNISNAITKGLNPNAKMKDSGIEWIGEIPAHWEVKKLKHVCSRSGLYGANIAATHYRETGIRFLRTTDITDDGKIRKEGVFLPEELVRDYILNDGDILLSRSGTVGRSFLYQSKLHGPCSYAGYLVRFVPNPHTLPKYVFFYTKTHAFERFLRLMAISATIENVNADKYANAHLPVPPFEEQKEIADYLDRETKKIDALVETCETAIGLLKERRTALISAAVTGNIDVRNAG